MYVSWYAVYETGLQNNFGSEIYKSDMFLWYESVK
jgi:hypothetical protein